MEIDSNEISVIIQGPVFGSSIDNFNNRYTLQALCSVRKSLPDAELILSTWKGSDINGLSFDILIENEDPGPIDLKTNSLLKNINRQIVSTRNGIRSASKKYVLKLRSDTILESPDFLKYFDSFELRNNSWRIFQKRVLNCTIVSQNPRKNPIPYNPSDWFHFGLKEDVKKIWDIPLILQVTDKYQDVHHYSPEQYIWVSCLRKFGNIKLDYAEDISEEAIDMTELTIVNNFVLLEPEQLGIRSLKYDKDHTDIVHYTHSEWLELYEQYFLNQSFPLFCKTGYRFSAIYPAFIQDNKNLIRKFINIISTSLIEENISGLTNDSRIITALQSGSGHLYRFLFFLVKAMNPALTIEFATGNGLSTLCLAHNLLPSSSLITFDNKCWENNEGTYLSPQDFEPKNVFQIVFDLSLSEQLDKISPIISKSDLIVLNISNGSLVNKLLKLFESQSLKKGTLIIINNIKIWQMIPFWESIKKSKLDITSFGSWKGTGLVEW